MGGLLTAYQRANIVAGSPIAQRFSLWLPISPGDTPTASSIGAYLHDDRYNVSRVIDAGVRRVGAYNVSMMQPGQLRLSDYVIEVDNRDGKFYPGGAHWYQLDTSPPYGSRYCEPGECWLVHNVYVMYSGAWSEITGVAYKGQIDSVEYNDTKRTATISSRCIAANYLARKWSEDDADDYDTGMDMVL